MSEPLSSTEIEDVLSSIRRLVSDDLRPLMRSATASPAPVAADKLILTPALRVVQEEAPQVFAPSAPYRLHLGLPAQTAPAGLDQVVASVGAAVDAQALEWEAETGDAAPFVAVSMQDEWQDSDIAAFAPDADVAATAIKDADEIILRDAIGDTQGDSHGNTHGNTLGADPEVLQPEAAAPMPGWAQQEAEAISDPARDDLDAPILSHGTIEPDPAWADAAEASVIASLAAEAAGDDHDTADTGYDDAPMLFDEEVLRELVRDILREELAGRMGERITRNIRKLVRAEIARSFATQEFE